MPLYFFDVTDAGDTIDDEFGVDLADEVEARLQAISFLPAIAREVMQNGDRHEVSVTVRDEHKQAVYEASLTLHGRWWPRQR